MVSAAPFPPEWACRVAYESAGEQARRLSLYLLAAASIALNALLLWKDRRRGVS